MYIYILKYIDLSRFQKDSVFLSFWVLYIGFTVASHGFTGSATLRPSAVDTPLFADDMCYNQWIQKLMG